MGIKYKLKLKDLKLEYLKEYIAPIFNFLKPKKKITNISELLGYQYERVEKDISMYKSNIDKFDVVIYSTPDGVGMCTAEDDLNRGAKVIDYSGDFRFNNMSKYEQYINFIGRKIIHKSPHLLNQTQYGLPELHNFLLPLAYKKFVL